MSSISETESMNRNLRNHIPFRMRSSNIPDAELMDRKNLNHVPPSHNPRTGRPLKELMYCYYDDLGLPTWNRRPPTPASSQNDSDSSIQNSEHYNFQHLRESFLPKNRGVNARVNFNGFVRLDLDNNTYIDITVNKAIRVANELIGSFMAVSGDNSRWAFKHKLGQVTQIFDHKRKSENSVKVLVFCKQKTNKFAKLFRDKVLFGCEGSELVYKMDKTGTKTKMDKGLPTLGKGDYTKQIMMNYSAFGSRYRQDADRLKSRIKFYSNRTENWIIDDIKIIRNNFGVIKIWKGRSTRLTIGPYGKACLNVRNEKCTASCDQIQRHLFVKIEPNCVYYDGNQFSVRHKKLDAGFKGADNRIRLFR